MLLGRAGIVGLAPMGGGVGRSEDSLSSSTAAAAAAAAAAVTMTMKTTTTTTKVTTRVIGDYDVM